MEDAKRMLLVTLQQRKKDLHVSSSSYEQLKIVLRARRHKRRRIRRYSCAMRYDKLCSFECFFSTGRREAENESGHLENCTRHLGELLELKLFRNLCAS